MRLNRRSYLTKLTKRGARAALLYLFAGTIALSIGLNLLLAITGITSLQASGDAGTQAGTAITGIGLAVSIALYGIATPLVEEFVFRGMFYSAVYTYALRKTGPSPHRSTAPDADPQPENDGRDGATGHKRHQSDAAIGIICTDCQPRPFLIAAGLSSLMFALYHWNLAQGIYAFAMGMTFCLAYELTGQFLSAWILHAACNIIALLLSNPVNGTNAFTQLCTLPWTAAFLAVAIAAGICLYRCFHPRESTGM